MVQFKILAGGFTSFIAGYVFDSDASTLTLTSQTETLGAPSWIVGHPTNKAILYATNELSPVGSLESFTVAEDLSLTSVDSVSSGGNAPTFAVVLSTGELTGANFGSPNATFAPLDPNDPTKFVKDGSGLAPVVNFPRPEGSSNPHATLEVNGEILVPDLGADRIWRVSKPAGSEAFQVTGEIAVDAGAGPRHIAMQGDVLLTLHEKISTLTAQHIPQGPNGTSAGLLANVSIIPPNVLEGQNFAAAEILVSQVSERFPEQFIYVSNRNIGETIDPNGDTIAIFQLKNNAAPPPAAPAPAAPLDAAAHIVTDMITPALGYRRRSHARDFVTRQEAAPAFTLELVAQVPTGLQQIRSFAIGPVDTGADEFLIAGANTNGGVSVFRREDGGRALTLVANDQALGNRTSFVFV